MNHRDQLRLVPSLLSYVTALKGVENLMTEVDERFLRAHFEAPKHSASAGEIARSAGYNSFRATNLHYGRFAQKLRGALDQPSTSREYQVSILATFESAAGIKEMQLTMRPQLVIAIRDLRWFN